MQPHGLRHGGNREAPYVRDFEDKRRLRTGMHHARANQHHTAATCSKTVSATGAEITTPLITVRICKDARSKITAGAMTSFKYCPNTAARVADGVSSPKSDGRTVRPARTTHHVTLLRLIMFAVVPNGPKRTFCAMLISSAIASGTAQLLWCYSSENVFSGKRGSPSARFKIEVRKNEQSTRLHRRTMQRSPG